MGLRFATIATSLAVAHGFSSTAATRSSNRVCLSPDYVSRTSPLVAQGGFGPFNDQYGVFRRRPELGRSFSRARESWGNSWNSWSSRSFGFRGNEDPETAIPVAIAKAAALSVAVVAGAYAAPAIWAVVNSGETDSEAVTAFFGAGAAAAGFATAFSAIGSSAVEEARLQAFQQRTRGWRDFAPDVSASALAAGIALAAAIFATPSIWEAATSAFTEEEIEAEAVTAALGASFAFAAAAAAAFTSISSSVQEEADFSRGRGRGLYFVPPPAVMAKAGAFSAACTALSFLAPFAGAIIGGEAEEGTLSAFGAGAAMASGFSVLFFAMAKTSIEDARLNVISLRSRIDEYYGRTQSSLSSSAFAAGTALAGAIFATPIAWAECTEAFEEAAAPEGVLMAALFGTACAFAAATSLAFNSLGKAIEEGEYDPQLRSLRRQRSGTIGGAPRYDLTSPTFGAAGSPDVRRGVVMPTNPYLVEPKDAYWRQSARWGRWR